MEQGVNRRDKYKRNQGGRGETPDDGPRQRGLGVGTFADP